MSPAFQDEVGFFGRASSPAFVRAPEGNGCAERLLRLLKENLLWLETFDTVEDLRLALHEFRRQYSSHRWSVHGAHQRGGLPATWCLPRQRV